MKNQSFLLINISIVIIGALLFLPFLGSVHLFDWDENIFAESAREMLVTGDFYKVQSNYLPFQEKPPFFFWLQAISMTIFGVNEFAARFPNAIVGITTLLLLFNLGNRYFSQKFGVLWVLAYMGSFLPHFYFRTAMIDPTFNLFIFSGIFSLALFANTDKNEKTKRNWLMILAGTLIGLAILTKGPVALLITLLTAIIYAIVKKDIRIVKFTELIRFILPMTLIACAWFGIEAAVNGPWFIKEFILYQIFVFQQPHSGHSGPFFYHFIVLLIGCFPVSFYLFKAFGNHADDSVMQKEIKLIMMILMAVVLLIFSIVKTKLVHYSSLCYFPISFLAAYVIEKSRTGSIVIGNTFKTIMLLFGILVSSVLLGANLFLLNKDSILADISPYIKDDFALANLQTPLSAVSWGPGTGAIYLMAFVFGIYLLKQNLQKASVLLFVSTIFAVQLTTYSVVPEIEEMIQGEAIRFYKEKGKEDAYLATYGFKSFGYLFYGKKKPNYRVESLDENWLMHGKVDKPVYMVAKMYNCKPLDENPNFNRLYTKSGYVFYKREK